MRRVHGGETTESFTPLENTQITILFNAFVQRLENSFLQHREGLVSQAVFYSYGWTWGMVHLASKSIGGTGRARMWRVPTSSSSSKPACRSGPGSRREGTEFERWKRH
jgi:hypothetical protein